MPPPISSPRTQAGSKATASSPAAAATTSGGAPRVRGRSDMEMQFDKLRTMDRLDDGVDAIGPKGLQHLCGELGIAFNEIEFYITMWKLGASQSYCMTRAEWMHSVYTWKLDHLGNLKAAIPTWKNSVLNDEGLFTEMYHASFDFIRGDEDKLLPLDKALKAWHVLLPEASRFKYFTLWAQWMSVEYRRPISRDIWIELWEFARRVKDINQYDPNDKWPTAMDDFVEWALDQR